MMWNHATSHTNVIMTGEKRIVEDCFWTVILGMMEKKVMSSMTQGIVSRFMLFVPCDKSKIIHCKKAWSNNDMSFLQWCLNIHKLDGLYHKNSARTQHSCQYQSRHLGSSTAANWVSFDLNVSCSSCWGYSLINTLKLKKIPYTKKKFALFMPKNAK